MHFARLVNTLLKHEESARDNHVLACKFAKYLGFTDLRQKAQLSHRDRAMHRVS